MLSKSFDYHSSTYTFRFCLHIFGALVEEPLGHFVFEMLKFRNVFQKYPANNEYGPLSLPFQDFRGWEEGVWVQLRCRYLVLCTACCNPVLDSETHCLKQGCVCLSIPLVFPLLRNNLTYLYVITT